ncbi:MAG: choice-of-anchor D domain-containing protein [Hydrogenothermaceae bacterium]|nr:choice-of-anchor D domain-containing protein [Hydrogenothermaceae bacterium]
MKVKVYLKILAIFLLVYNLVSCKGSSSSNTTYNLLGHGEPKLQKKALVGDNLELVKENGEQQNPQIIYLRDKKIYFLVWEDWRDGNGDVYGKFLKEDGTACGTEFKINTNSEKHQTSPSIAYRQNEGRVLIVWQDGRYNTNDGGIYYRALDLGEGNINCNNFNPEGKLGNEGKLNYTSIFSDNLVARIKPKVKYNEVKDEFVIVWIENRDRKKSVRQECFKRSVFYSFGSDSTFVGYAKIKGDLSSIETDIIRSRSSNSEYKVRKISYTEPSPMEEIHTYEYLDNISGVDVECDNTSGICSIVVSGERAVGNLKCSCTNNGEGDNDNVCDDNDVVTETWEYEKNNTVKSIYQIYDFEINQATVLRKLNSGTSPAENPAIKIDPVTKRFLVVWEDFRDGGLQKIYGALLSSGSGIYGTDFKISDSGSFKYTSPNIGYDDVNQRFFVIWQDSRNGSVSIENMDIYGQYVESEGSFRGSNYFISTHNANQLSPVIAYNPDKNEFLVVWKDGRNKDTSGSDIYAQRFTLGQPQIEIYTEDGSILRPPLLDFGTLNTGSIATKSIKIRNIGDSNLKIYDLSSLSQPFTYSGIDNKLTDSDKTTYLELVPGAEISITIQFSPKSPSTYTSSITVHSDAGDKIISLQGNSVSALMFLEEGDNQNNGELDFKQVRVGSSKDMIIKITNNGNISYKITNVISNNEKFEILEIKDRAANFPINLNPGSSVIFTVRYKSDFRENATGKIYISTDNPSLSTNSINLSAKAIAPILYINQNYLDFGQIKVNDSFKKGILVRNTGDDTLNILSCGENISGFEVEEPCPKTIEPGMQATIYYIFKPKEVIGYSGKMLIKTDAGDKEISLTGQGKGAKISVNLESIDFGMVAVNTESTKELVITNTGNDNLNISKISVGDNFSILNMPVTPVNIIPNSSLKLLIKYTPKSSGIHTSKVNISSDVINGSIEIPLQGTGVTINVEISQSIVDFGEVNINETKSMVLSIKNNSSKDISILSIDKPSSPFTIEEPNNKTIKAGETLKLVAKFNPTVTGTFSSTLSLLFDHSSTPTVITIKGKGIGNSKTTSTLEFDKEIINFGKILIGQTYAQTIGIKSASNTKITSISISPPYKVLRTPPFQVSSTGDNITITIDADKVGIYNTVLTLKDSNGNVSQIPVYGEVVDVLVEGVKDYSKISKNPNISGFNFLTGLNIVSERSTLSIQYKNLPSSPVLYIKKGSDYKQIYPQNTASECVSSVSIQGDNINMEIKDNSDCDIDSSNNVVSSLYIGTSSRENITPTPSTSNNTPVFPPSPTGGGGCSMGRGGGLDFGWFIVTLLGIFARMTRRVQI